MLVKLVSKFIPTAPSNIFIMVAPSTPVSVFSLNHGDGLIVGHESHNNGGYKKVQGDKNALLAELANAGANMVEFRVSGGSVNLNVQKDIPLSLCVREFGCSVGYPTHNNGGYRVCESITSVVEKINAALALQ